MTTIGLLALAAEAETLHIRRSVEVKLRRLAFVVGAYMFAGAALVLLHVAGWYALAPEVGTVPAALILAGADSLAALALAVLGRSRPDPVAAEASALRSLLLGQALRGGTAGMLGRQFAGGTPVSVIGGVIAEALVAAIQGTTSRSR